MQSVDTRQETFTIQELASAFSVTPRTLRYYEGQGLISPRRIGQQRIYSSRDKARVAWILRGKRVGFSLTEISEMLDLYDLGDGRETQRQVTLENCRKRIHALESQRNDINATIKELSQFCDILEKLIINPKTGKWMDQETGSPPSRDFTIHE